MQRDNYLTTEQIKAQERKFQAGRMEEESQLREAFGAPEDREHERMRVNQEWEKIEEDKAKGENDDGVWRNHLDRMTRMARSLKCPKKAARRAKHFEMAGLATASKVFQNQSERLCEDSKKPINPEKDLLIDNLCKFNEFVNAIEKYEPRQTWEVWTQPSGKRVTKIPSGNIVPFEGGVVQDRSAALSGKPPVGTAQAAAKKEEVTASPDTKPAKTTLGNKFNFRKNKDGKFSSAHFNKSVGQLAKEVREYLANQKKQSKYVMVRDMADAQRRIPDFRKYNSGIGQAETYAREYGDRGLGKKEDVGKADPEKKFWLGMTLVMRDVAAEFAHLRNAAEKK